jgi:hypothetical protein
MTPEQLKALVASILDAQDSAGRAANRANAIAESTQNPTQTSLDRLAEDCNDTRMHLRDILRAVYNAHPETYPND